MSKEDGKVLSAEILTKVTDKVQAQLNTALEKIALIYKWTESNPDSSNARQLLQQYQDTVWPLLIEVDERTKELAVEMRRAIDACTLKDAHLEQLLHLNRFQIEAARTCAELAGPLTADLELVLDIRRRAAHIEGVALDEGAIGRVAELQTQIRGFVIREEETV